MIEKPAPGENHYSVQEYLSLGYVYLIVLGIIGDVIYYKFLGINILNYSTIFDVLMAPINTLIYDVRILAIVVFLMGGIYLFYVYLLPSFHRRNRDKEWYRKQVKDIEKVDARAAAYQGNQRIMILLVFFPLLFVGLKFGSGTATRERLSKRELKTTHHLDFADKTRKQVRIIGQNSGFIFYWIEGEKEVSITPINGNIKEIQRLSR